MIYSSVKFKCIICSFGTNIFFENKFDLTEVREKAKCTKCGLEKYCNVGDLGYRNDLPNADYPPWQAQFIRVDSNIICCDECCLNKKEIFSMELIATCPYCDQLSMKSVNFKNVENKKLFDFINSLKYHL